MNIKPKVFVTRELPKGSMDLLYENCDVELNKEDRVLSKEELICGVKGKKALLCLLTDTIDKEIIDANPGLNVIANYAVGFNNIDVEYATSKGIPVTNTPGVLTDTTADMAFALLMAAGRRITESERFLRAGKFKGWAPKMFLGHDIFGKTIGIVGFGRIGRETARRGVLGFKMKALYYNPNLKDLKLDFEAKSVSFDTLLQQSDYISIHLPLNEETTHFISTNEFEKMKNTAVLINTSRGPIVDEKALVDALKNEKIAAAGLDVFENEPEVEPGLLELENAVIVPHIASASIETRTKMAEMAIENLIAALKGEVPPNIVNKDIYDKK